MEITDKEWPASLQYIIHKDTRLAYRLHSGGELTVVYVGGFHSNMNGEKAIRIFKHAKARGHSALCFDYSGHGSSEGEFAELTISDWLNDTLYIVSEFVTGPLVFVGSSMGGWIALLASMRLRERVKGIVTIAAATDMTEIIWNRCSPEQRRILNEQGYFDWDSQYDDEPYRITMKLIEDGKRHLILNNEIPVYCPVRMIHGTRDSDINWQNSIETIKQLASDDTDLQLIENAGHRLSEPDQIVEILKLLDDILQKLT